MVSNSKTLTLLKKYNDGDIIEEKKKTKKQSKLKKGEIKTAKAA